jgi:hypothetical protein
LGSQRRKNKQRINPAAQPAVPPGRKPRFLVVAAIVLCVGIAAGAVVALLVNREADVAKDASTPRRGTPAGADAAETPPSAEEQTAKTALPSGEAETPPPRDVSTKTKRTNAASGDTPSFETLKGRWRRPDGGYVVAIKSVDASGKIDASYSNPKRINVSTAEASRDGSQIKVFIELRDVNYPGSTYNLVYDPKSDELQGIYYQAALQQRFEVFFVRMP